MDDELQLGYAGDDVESDADAACEPSDEVVYAEDRPLPCEFRTGRAGTGKTFSLVAECERDTAFGQLTATTGIASVNLGAITLHSTLRYSDTASLRDAFISGRLARVLHGIGLTRRRLLVDEASMLDGEQLDLIVRGAIEANRYKDMTSPLGITLVGDFAQLPPVRAKWCFEADSWPRFAERTTRLERVWRQDTGAFLDALNFARVGDGIAAADILTQAAGAGMWHTALNPEYDGTTILPKNVQVDRYNMMALDRVSGARVAVTSRRWGKLSRSWDNIPERLELKVGAYVMVLANSGGAIAIDVLTCKQCGRKIDSYEAACQEGVRLLQKEVHSAPNKKLEQTSAKSSLDMLDVLPISVDKADVAPLENGDAQAQSSSGAEANRTNTFISGRLCESVPTGPSQGDQGRSYLPPSGGHGEEVGSPATKERDRSSSKRNSLGQSATKSATSDMGYPSGHGSMSILSNGICDTLGCPYCHSTKVNYKRNITFEYCNGDCGHVVAHVPATREDDEHFIVHLVRTDHEVDVYRLVRGVEQADRPDGWSGETIHRTLDAGEYIPRAHYRGKVKRYVLGQVEYFPLRLAYSSTVHKSQGLTLDRAQIDIRDHFFASPAMCYVALSRCRTLAGLRIVGQRERFVKNCNVDRRVLPWL